MESKTDELMNQKTYRTLGWILALSSALVLIARVVTWFHISQNMAQSGQQAGAFSAIFKYLFGNSGRLYTLGDDGSWCGIVFIAVLWYGLRLLKGNRSRLPILYGLGVLLILQLIVRKVMVSPFLFVSDASAVFALLMKLIVVIAIAFLAYTHALGKRGSAAATQASS